MNPSPAELISRKLPARNSGWRCFVGCAVASWFLSSALGAEVDLTPISTADGLYTQVTVAGQPVWQNTGTARYLYGRRPNSFAFTVGQTLYVRVTYFDDAGGTVDLQFDAQTSSTKSSTLTTRTSRVNTGRFVDGFFELPDVLFNKRQTGSSDFRIICGTTTGAKVPVSRITLSDTPFANADFQLAISRSWQTRYTGPAKDYVDATTLKGKVMTGYQGWFGTPNDIADLGGWKHWSRASALIPENFTMDAWPDLTEYDPASLIRAADVVTGSGSPAYLFSSRSYSAVQKHFRWMRKHNMDGAFVQRFNPKAGAEAEWVLRNVSQAAAEEGLIWAVEYDVSGMADATVAAKLQADWEWLTTQFDLLNDPRYVREGGKPVVFIWGFPFDSRGFTTTSANTAVDYFKAQGAYVIGGIPNSWNSLSAAWKTHIEKYDGVLVWQNGSTPDAAFFRGRGQDFYPHIWPGFSWANLQQQPATPPIEYTDRAGGQFYWDKGRDWINASAAADRLFIGMFDEYDEGTNVMPMTDDPPDPSATYGRFIDNQGKPSDWWMMLTDELKRMMFGQRTNTGTLPTVASLSNRSNIGAEASVDLGTTDIVASLSRVAQADGNTTVETVGTKVCRGNTTPATDRYMYFNVNNTFAYQLVNGDVTIEVEYYDNTDSTVLGLQYDSASANYTTHPQSITTTGSNTWRTVRFEIADAYFGGRQNGSSDFRLTFGGKKLNVNRVWVRLPEGKSYPFTWTNAAVGPALNWSQNVNWLGGIVGQSDPTSTIRLFPGQTMPGGTIPISNNLTGQQFGSLQLGGTASSSADTTVTLGGNAFSLGGTAPTLTLDATKTAFDLIYDISAPITLLGTTQVSGNGNANLRLSGIISGSGGLTKSNTGTLTLTGANGYSGDTTITAGILKVGAGATGKLGTGNVINNAALEFNTSDSNTYPNIFSGTGTLTHNGSGTTTLTGIPSFSGITTLNAGTLKFVDAAVTTNRSYAAIAAGAALEFNAATGDQNAGSLALSGQGTFRKTGNFTSLVDSATSTVAMGSGALVHITQGIFDFGAGTPGNWSANLSDLQVDTGDTFDGSATGVVIDALNGAGTVKIAGNATDGFGLKLGVDGGSGTFSGVISNSTPDGNQFSLVKTGAGTQLLSGVSTYSGQTTISEGILEIGGSGRLGNGTYAGAITIASGAVLRHKSTTTQTLSGVISGAGSLVKDTGGQLTISGANSLFSGGSTIKNGTLRSATTTTTLGTGTVSMGGGGSSGATFITGQSNANAFTINAPDSGTVVIGADGSGSGFTLNGPVTLNGNLTFQTFNNAISGTTKAVAIIAGGLTGTGNLLLNNLGLAANTIELKTVAINHVGTITLQGTATGNTTLNAALGPNISGVTQNSATSMLILNGTNTYAGNTTVNVGTLRITKTNPGNDGSTVTLAATGATLDLTYTGTDKVNRLVIGTTQMADGTYGKSGSTAPVISISQITGNGTLTVGPTLFSSWITGTFANGQVPTNQRGLSDDSDNDGIRNLMEYAIAGQDPTVSNPTVGSLTANTLSFAKRQGTSGLTYAIQKSTDLGIADSWAELPAGASYINNPTTISYTVTPGIPAKNFLRLQVLSN